MLTKEESQALYNCLVGLTLRPDEIKERIKKFTEKLEPEIYEGEIYKNFAGQFLAIVKVDQPDDPSGCSDYPIKAKYIYSDFESDVFTSQGNYDSEPGFPELSLDLSQKI